MKKYFVIITITFLVMMICGCGESSNYITKYNIDSSYQICTATRYDKKSGSVIIEEISKSYNIIIDKYPTSTTKNDGEYHYEYEWENPTIEKYKSEKINYNLKTRYYHGNDLEKLIGEAYSEIDNKAIITETSTAFKETTKEAKCIEKEEYTLTYNYSNPIFTTQIESKTGNNLGGHKEEVIDVYKYIKSITRTLNNKTISSSDYQKTYITKFDILGDELEEVEWCYLKLPFVGTMVTTCVYETQTTYKCSVCNSTRSTTSKSTVTETTQRQNFCEFNFISEEIVQYLWKIENHLSTNDEIVEGLLNLGIGRIDLKSNFKGETSGLSTSNLIEIINTITTTCITETYANTIKKKLDDFMSSLDKSKLFTKQNKDLIINKYAIDKIDEFYEIYKNIVNDLNSLFKTFIDNNYSQYKNNLNFKIDLIERNKFGFTSTRIGTSIWE